MSEFSNQRILAHNYDYLVVLNTADEVSRFILNKDSLVIGRTENCDIHIDDKRISRQHARLERSEDAQYTIVDLNSTGGIYIDDVKIQSEEAMPLAIGTIVRLGDTLVRIEIPTEDEAKNTFGNAATQYDIHNISEYLPEAIQNEHTNQLVQQANEAETDPEVPRIVALDTTNEYIRAILIPPAIILEPGGIGSIVLDLVNASRRAEHFVIEVENISRDWVTLPHHSLFLEADSSQLLSIPLHPPRMSQNQVGIHPFILKIRGINYPQLETSVQGQIELTGYLDFDLQLRPDRFENSQYTTLKINNEGNLTDTFFILQPNDSVGIEYNLPQDPIALLPGEQKESNIIIKTTQVPTFGRELYVPFAVGVQSNSSNITKEAQGLIVVKPRWSVLLIVTTVITLFLCGLISAMSLLFSFNVWQQSNSIRQTQIAQTQTEIFQLSDEDEDDLNFRQETTLGTDPLSNDSDSDGLSDGDEVNTHQTNPLEGDTDGDGLSDGDEVNTHLTNPLEGDTDGNEVLLTTNPLVMDTDQDGLNDGDDPLPLQAFDLNNPDEFVSYYYALINANRLDVAFDLLTENFLNANALTSESYALWWDTVESVEISSMSIVTADDNFACILTNLQYVMIDGTRVDDNFPFIILVRDSASDDWRIDRKVNAQSHG